jgi:hypothetical protein
MVTLLFYRNLAPRGGGGSSFIWPKTAQCSPERLLLFISRYSSSSFRTPFTVSAEETDNLLSAYHVVDHFHNEYGLAHTCTPTPLTASFKGDKTSMP